MKSIKMRLPCLEFPCLLMPLGAFDTIVDYMEGSHSGRVRAPAKRLTRESGFMGSNPIPSATWSIPVQGPADQRGSADRHLIQARAWTLEFSLLAFGS